MAQQALALMEAARDLQQVQVELLVVELLILEAINQVALAALVALETMQMVVKAVVLEHLQQTL
jgi:hypothetical protein